MECVLGLVGKGFAIVAADTSAVHSILLHKNNEDKIMLLDSRHCFEKGLLSLSLSLSALISVLYCLFNLKLSSC